MLTSEREFANGALIPLLDVSLVLITVNSTECLRVLQNPCIQRGLGAALLLTDLLTGGEASAQR